MTLLYIVQYDIMTTLDYSLLCHLPCMLKVIQVHQLVVLALIVVTCEVALHTIHDCVTVLSRVGIAITQLFKITPINLIMGKIEITVLYM